MSESTPANMTDDDLLAEYRNISEDIGVDIYCNVPFTRFTSFKG